MVKSIRKFIVRAVVPDRLSALNELVGNLRWSWNEPTRRLFSHIDPAVWDASGHDPVQLLGRVDPTRLDELAADDTFVAWVERERADLRAYLTEPRWAQSLGDEGPRLVGYFSPEFGVSAVLPQYSGGLGILAGDHLKAASDLGVPLVGVGLFYKSGYFAQSLTVDGWQQERYLAQDPDGLPLALLRQADGTPAQIILALPDGASLHARIWKAAVGRVTLLLLDADVPANTDEFRTVTDRLYGGGGEHRLLQELLLGVGGVRALKVWSELGNGPTPEVFHMNEGHAGFLGLERIASYIADGSNFGEALQIVRSSTVFTTHTPVDAGIDRFDQSLVGRYLTPELLPGIDPADAVALGREPGADPASSPFNMAMMGLRLAQHANGVSKLHGEVSRGMFRSLWAGFDVNEVPISSITNGVHAPTWVDPDLIAFAERVLGTSDAPHADWLDPRVTDADLWAVKRHLREKLITDVRRRVKAAWRELHPGGTPPMWMDSLLDPDTLTVGFARRVPTYKRLTLMLQDPERLKAILTDPERPVQLIIAGKSHPADDEGKRLIQRVIQFAAQEDLRERMVFLPDYDMAMAATLYPGCDVWLNNPLRPLEACGTSGMKAAMNGALNLSILDGWWAEYAGNDYGWVIPSADAAGDSGRRDALEAHAMYDLLQSQIATTFYPEPVSATGGQRQVPTEWVRRVRSTLAHLAPDLGADRMVKQYVEELYLPAAASVRAVVANSGAGARDLAAYAARVRAAWAGVKVLHVETGGVDQASVGDQLLVRAQLALGSLTADDVTVELIAGRSRADDTIANPVSLPLDPTPGVPGEYQGTVALTRAGAFGYTVRVVPKHPLLRNAAELGLISIAE